MKRGRKSSAELSVIPASPRPVQNYAATPVAPSHLSPDMTAWWRQIVSEYSLEPHHLHLLRAACEAWDRMQQAREAVAKHGLTSDDKGMCRARPEVAMERDSKIAFARLIRELDLDSEPPSQRSRPPAILSNRR